MSDSYVEGSFAIDLLSDAEVEWWTKEVAREVDPDIDIEEMEPAYSTDWEFEGRSIWFHGDPSLNVEASAGMIQRFLKECRPEGSLGFCWAENCSKPRLDSFGGGACFITANHIEWNGSHDWLQKQQTEFAGSEAGFPRINLSFSGWSRDVELTECLEFGEGEYKKINLAGVTSDELASKVKHGVWVIALSDCLGQSTKEEIEISDVEASSR